MIDRRAGDQARPIGRKGLDLGALVRDGGQGAKESADLGFVDQGDVKPVVTPKLDGGVVEASRGKGVPSRFEGGVQREDEEVDAEMARGAWTGGLLGEGLRVCGSECWGRRGAGGKGEEQDTEQPR